MAALIFFYLQSFWNFFSEVCWWSLTFVHLTRRALLVWRVMPYHPVLLAQVSISGATSAHRTRQNRFMFKIPKIHYWNVSAAHPRMDESQPPQPFGNTGDPPVDQRNLDSEWFLSAAHHRLPADPPTTLLSPHALFPLQMWTLSMPQSSVPLSDKCLCVCVRAQEHVSLWFVCVLFLSECEHCVFKCFFLCN